MDTWRNLAKPKLLKSFENITPLKELKEFLASLAPSNEMLAKRRPFAIVLAVHGGRASPRNGIFANVDVYQDLPQKF